VVDGAAAVGVLEEHQLERGVGDGEVGVAGPDLGGLGGEQAGVEVDGLVEVADIESELQAAHGGSSGASARICGTQTTTREGA
jgi:hypothetical protein